MTLDIFGRYTIPYIESIMETYKTKKEEMRSYRNYSATNGRIVRESDVSSPDKQKYDIDVIIPFIAKKFENGIFKSGARTGSDNFFRGLTIEISLA